MLAPYTWNNFDFSNIKVVTYIMYIHQAKLYELNIPTIARLKFMLYDGKIKNLCMVQSISQNAAQKWIREILNFQPTMKRTSKWHTMNWIHSQMTEPQKCSTLDNIIVWKMQVYNSIKMSTSKKVSPYLEKSSSEDSMFLATSSCTTKSWSDW